VRSWGTIIAGAIGLAVLDAIVSTSSGASNVGGFLAGLGSAVQKIISPQVPAFHTTSGTSANSTPAGAPQATTAATVIAGAPTTEVISPTMGHPVLTT
jgi:hypothetical protein